MNMDQDILLQMTDITKTFPGVKALDHVSLTLKRGTVHALMGENGAGKSTLMKCLFGIYNKDSGTILLEGKEVNFKNSREALDNGVAMVHQELNQALKRSVMDNIWLGRYPKHLGLVVDETKMYRETMKIFDELGINVDPHRIMSTMPVSQRQMVEIAKAVSYRSKVIVFDEPTSSLTEDEVEHLFRIINMLRDRGVGIIYISHKMAEIKRISDEITIMRDGQWIATRPAAELEVNDIIRLMVGRDVSLDIEKEEMEFGKTVFSVKDLVYVDQFGKTRLDHVSFSIKEGQILGIAGIDGNGQSELVEAIVGTLKQQQGTITMNGKDISNALVLARQEAGISHVSEDRMKFGTAPKLSLEDNTISKVYYTDKLKTHGLLDSKKISEFTNRILKEFLVKYDNSKQSIAELSGGNVQKVVVGREFDYEPDLLIMNQPTRGIDVGAIEFIRKKIVDMRSRKKAILLVSADLSEILSLSDTILVMHEGRIVGHIADVKKTSENELGLYMLGVKEDSKEQIGGAYCE